jgi:hypothetical protein
VNKISMNNYDLITLLDFYNFLKHDLKVLWLMEVSGNERKRLFRWILELFRK